MAPPAKRKRRNVLPSSSPTEVEDEEEPVFPPRRKLVDLVSSSPPPPPRASRRTMSTNASSQAKTAPGKLKPRVKTANHPLNAAPIHLPTSRDVKAGSKSVTASPEKPKRKINMDEKGKSGDIFTFFTKQAQRQQAEVLTGRSKTNLQDVKASQAEDVDMISDDEVLSMKIQPASVVGQAARKRARISDPSKDFDASQPSASQRYITNVKPPAEMKSEDDLRPWAERFAPIDLEELAVHKRKVSDVRTWLENVMDGRMRQRLLILKGAAGTAKTTTLQLLAKSMDCKVLEWRNPVGSMATEDGYQSMSAQFEEFMGRGGRFGQLDIFSSNGTVQSKPDIKPLDRRKSIILIEEFPNTFTKSSTALQSFRSAVIQYLASNTPPLSVMYNASKDPITPVVMIISETLLTTTSASADSFTAHRLLGPEILQHPGVATLEFNAIAPTILAKALELVVKKEAKKSGRRRTPGPLVLKRLGEIGDVRSAVGSLEFLCLRGDLDWGSKVTFGKTKGKKDASEPSLTRMEAQSLELVTRREASLDIFHAVGKVVYNKRDEIFPSSIPNEVEKLPDFMSLHCRPRKSQVMVDELIDETGTDTQTFVAALHENYILSCDAPPTSFDVSTLDHVNGCIDALSDSDLLCPSWDGSLNASGFGGGSGGRGSGGDILRQDEISFQIAVRGILFALPCPVKRFAPAAAAGLRKGGRGEATKMFYPTSLKLWRMREEIEASIDLWVVRLMKGEQTHDGNITAGANAFMRPQAGSVESWRNARTPPATQRGKVEDATPLLSVGTSARKEMLLERLPYMVSIARGKSRRNHSASSMLTLKEMEKATSFRGIGVLSDDSADEGDEEAGIGEQWATDGNVEGSQGKPRKKVKMVARGNGKTTESLGLTAAMEQKLVLSDDDIEDD